MEKPGGSDVAPLALESFLPYRLSVLTNTVSRAIAGAYAERFGLSIAEWRVMAVLGRFPGLSAADVAARTAMDKVRVSRAVSSLLRAGRLARTVDAQDRRRSVLALSAAGQEIYAQIVPLATAYERRLIEPLSAAERCTLDSLLARLMASAKAL